MNRNPIYTQIYALASHDPKCTTVQRSPRVYRGACQCGWTGSATTGSKALLEMLAHAKATATPAIVSHEGERG